MSRIFGKPKIPSSGYPFFGVVTLLKNATRSTMKNGKKQWKAFGSFEKPPKGDRSRDTTVSMTTGFDSDLAQQLIEWPKGTRLLVAGALQKSDYWTQRNGRESFELVVEFVHDQHDYNSAANQAADAESYGGTDEYGDSYDSGF